MPQPDYEKRIRELEDFKRDLSHRIKIVLFAVLAFGIVFGITLPFLFTKLWSVSSDVNKLSSEFDDLVEKAKTADELSGRALRQVGDVDKVIEQSKALIIVAQDAAAKATDESRSASAVSTVNDQKLRSLELTLVQVDKVATARRATPAIPAISILPVKISGNTITVRFEEGPTPYDSVTLNQSYYKGLVFVPPGATAKVTGNVSYCDFTISKALKGRVIDNTSGNSNTWNQE